MKYSLGLVVFLVVVIGTNCFAQVEVAVISWTMVYSFN